MLKKPAFGYCRVSSEEQKGNYSIPQQKKAISEYADNNGYKIVRFFIDDGVSATADNRPDFLQMVDECEEGHKKIVAIIVYHTDRFARNELDHALYKRTLSKAGVELISIMQLMINDSPEGHLIDTMMAGINAYYSRDLSRKTIRGMLGRWDAGWWPSWAPPGYVNINREGKLSGKFYSPEKQKLYDNLNRKLDPIEVDLLTGSLIAEAFQLYSTGNYSFTSLAATMSKKGLMDTRSQPIAPQSLHAVLHNTFYYGWMRQKKTGREKTGNHKALITKELFDLCTYVSAQHRQFMTRSRKHQFLLRGIALCAIHKGKRRISGYGKDTLYEEVEMRLTAEKHTDIHSSHRTEICYYHCPVCGCKTSYIETGKLEKQVADYIKKMEFNQEFINLVKNKIRDILGKNKDDIDGRVQALENHKKGFNNKLNKLIDMRADGEISREKFLEMQEESNGRIGELEQQIYELKTKAKIDYRLIDEVLSLTTNIYQTYIEAPDFLKRHYLRLFFDKVYIKDRKLWKVVENPVFSTLRKQEKVIINGHWLPDSLISFPERHACFDHFKNFFCGKQVICHSFIKFILVRN